MKQIKQKYARIVKYWRISYRQASGRDRLVMGTFTLMMLVYMWWAILEF
jgi:hypothetical protein